MLGNRPRRYSRAYALSDNASIQSEQFQHHHDDYDHADYVKYTVTHITRDSNRLTSLRVCITQRPERAEYMKNETLTFRSQRSTSQNSG